jgi:hypothetical protein
MAPELLAMLDDAPRRQAILREYARIHAELKQNAAQRAADAIMELVAS